MRCRELCGKESLKNFEDGTIMNKLTHIMQRRKTVLEVLLMVSEKQLKLVEIGDITTLLKLLARKQRYLDDLESVERSLDPHRGIAPEDRTWESEEERIECSSTIAKCDQLLAAIMELDKMSEQELGRQKDATQAQLQRTQSQGRAASAYARQNVAPSPARKPPGSTLDFKMD